MSSLLCKCGYVIKDTQYPLPTEGYILTQQGHDKILEAIGKGVAEFIGAITAGNRDKWICEFYKLTSSSSDFSDAEVIEDIVANLLYPSLVVSQCEQCGRLWVQKEPYSEHYRSFKPDDEW